jgi:hypothetical protein
MKEAAGTNLAPRRRGPPGEGPIMPHSANQASIFLPMLAVVLLTFIAFVRMAAGRAAAVKQGQDPNYYKAHLGRPEPEATIVAVRHYNNLFELPVLFYAGCLTAFVLGAVTIWTLVFAWGYVLVRVIQSAVHLSSNNTSHRGGAFVLGVLFMLALWINLALAIFSRV